MLPEKNRKDTIYIGIYFVLFLTRVGNMTLYEAARQYDIYLQTLQLSKAKLKAYHSGLQNILLFYGSETPVDSMDSSNVLDYVAVNDPFDCDPVHTKRGYIFCMFIHWMMRNRLIPAWAAEMNLIDQETASTSRVPRS